MSIISSPHPIAAAAGGEAVDARCASTSSIHRVQSRRIAWTVNFSVKNCERHPCLRYWSVFRAFLVSCPGACAAAAGGGARGAGLAAATLSIARCTRTQLPSGPEENSIELHSWPRKARRAILTRALIEVADVGRS